MAERNIEIFNSFVKEFLHKDSTYKQQIENFQAYLKKYNLEDRVFNLYETNIDDFFEYAFEQNIGTDAQLTSHIAALKALFGFLIDKKQKFSDLNGYISTPSFKGKYLERVDRSFSKKFLPMTLVNKVLFTLDTYIESNKGGNFKKLHDETLYLDVLIARLFIKLSLILPLKTTQLLEIALGDVRGDSFRFLLYNSVMIKLPNNLRKDILFTIEYVEKKYGNIYTADDKIFEYLYAAGNKKGQREGINNTLPRVYEHLGLDEMLEMVCTGKKNRYLYPAESYKKTAIYNMLVNGANIVYLVKLTGLDMQTLLSDFEYDSLNSRDVDSNLNNSLLSCDYYEYL